MLKKLLLMLVLAACVVPAFGAQAATTPAKGAGGAAQETDARLAEALQLNLSAVKLHGAGNSKEALPLAERALKLREQALGPEHQLVAASLVNLGGMQFALANPAKGKSLYKRALAIYEKGEDANSAATLVKLHDALGVLERFAFADRAAAIEHFERSLALREKMPGAPEADVVKNLYTLAELYESRGRNDQALALHRRVVRIREKDEAHTPYGVIFALQRLSCLSQRLGREEESKDAERRAELIRAREEERRERETAAKVAAVDGQTLQGGVLNGRAISKPQPAYPAEAKNQRVSGTVFIYVTIDETGRVVHASSCGHPLLAEASLRAAYGARFSPTLLDGKPVKVNGVITYKFVLQ